MLITELDTFVRKFHQLWNDGVTAHLDLNTMPGWAFAFSLARSLVLLTNMSNNLLSKSTGSLKAPHAKNAVLDEKLQELKIQKLLKL